MHRKLCKSLMNIKISQRKIHKVNFEVTLSYKGSPCVTIKQWGCKKVYTYSLY